MVVEQTNKAVSTKLQRLKRRRFKLTLLTGWNFELL